MQQLWKVSCSRYEQIWVTLHRTQPRPLCGIRRNGPIFDTNSSLYLLSSTYLSPCRTETSSKAIQLILHLFLFAELDERKIHHWKQWVLHSIHSRQPTLRSSLPFAATNSVVWSSISGRVSGFPLTSSTVFVPQAFKELHTCPLS